MEVRVKILVISDAVSPALYDHFDRKRFAEVGMVVSCGDLHPDYLEFVVSMLNVPCFGVPGNHDGYYAGRKPLGWRSLDGRLIVHEGITMLGLGGCMRYYQGPFQYTEAEMRRRLLLLKPQLWVRKNRLDILVTHAPAFELGDMKEHPHRGFKVFRDILDTYRPRFFLHGHIHMSYNRGPRLRRYGSTTIINGYQHYLFDYEQGQE